MVTTDRTYFNFIIQEWNLQTNEELAEEQNLDLSYHEKLRNLWYYDKKSPKPKMWKQIQLDDVDNHQI